MYSKVENPVFPPGCKPGQVRENWLSRQYWVGVLEHVSIGVLCIVKANVCKSCYIPYRDMIICPVNVIG
jgi:hypothetical protein